MVANVRTIPAGVSVLVPVFNSELSLADLVARLHPVLRQTGEKFEAVLVNDGSRDRSWDVIGRLSRSHDWVRGVDLMRNYGQHNALLCAIRAARFDKIITLDDDLQNPPEEIPLLLDEIRKGADVAYGYPRQQHHGLLRDLASEITKLALQKTMGAQTARRVSAFRAFRTELRAAFARYEGPFVSIDVLLTWSTSNFVAVEVRHDLRKAGQSNYTVGKLFTHALNMLTGFTTLPLQLASFCGFGLTAFGAGILFYVVGRYLIQGTSVAGFPFLASIIAIFSGAQMFALGIIGEYLARLHMRTMEKPTYAVRTEVED
ncbi:Glycosyl transferase [Acidobacteriia bacterium SbA2]|nr:Glycosyl transferase [Acidobacteriia bacterium SbA2]